MVKSIINIRSNIYLKQNKEENLPIFLFPSLSQYNNIIHFVTTRNGGYSQPPFHNFNLALHVGDKKEHVLKNRIKLAKSLNIPFQNFTISNQVHGNHVSIVRQNDRGSGAEDVLTALKENDSMITDEKEVCLLIFVADCVPVFLYDNKKQIIGLVHAGWKGTVGLITQKTVNLMKTYFGSSSQDIICAIGPSIGPSCYQVGAEVVKKVRNTFPGKDNLIQNISADGKGYFNLWEANKLQLLDCKIPEKNIKIAELCTCCHSDVFFSSRKNNGITGRFAAGIMMRK